MEITLEQVERLREKAAVSYGQAKAALEYSGGRTPTTPPRGRRRRPRPPRICPSRWSPPPGRSAAGAGCAG